MLGIRRAGLTDTANPGPRSARVENDTTDEVTKYYFADSSRIAMRKYTVPQSMTVEYLLGDHLGSTSITTDKDGAKVSEMRYKPWGEVRYSWTATQSTTPAYSLTDYTFTGQFSYMDDPSTTSVTEGFGLMFYNARWYDPALGRFAQADTIIPGGVQGLDRYAYVNNSPINYTDPSGHEFIQEGPQQDKNKPSVANKYVPKPTPPKPEPEKQNNGDGVPANDSNNGKNKPCISVVCKPDDDLLGTYYEISDVVYPVTEGGISSEDKMMAEFTGVWWVDLVLLAHDISTIPIHSDWVARNITKENAYAFVGYEVHKNSIGSYTMITGFGVKNNTNSPITIEAFKTDFHQGEQLANFYIQPNKTIYITLNPNPVISSSATIYLSQGMKLTVNITP